MSSPFLKTYLLRILSRMEKDLIPCSPSDWFKVCITSIENLVNHLSCHLRCASKFVARCQFVFHYLFLNKLGFDQSFHRNAPNTIPMLLLNAKGGIRSGQVGHKLTISQVRFSHLEFIFQSLIFEDQSFQEPHCRQGDAHC